MVIGPRWLRNDLECAEKRPGDLKFLDIAGARLQIRNLFTQEKNYELVRIYRVIPKERSQLTALLQLCALECRSLEHRVADGTRTRNNQNHNLGLYH